jgi:hypothetical protein
MNDAHKSQHAALVLPDTSGWVKREPGDVIEAGTPCVVMRSFEARVYPGGALLEFGVTDQADYAVWTPPPAPVAPLSTDVADEFVRWAMEAEIAERPDWRAFGEIARRHSSLHEHPDPAPVAPVDDISTNQERPTLARVTWNPSGLVETRLVFRKGGLLHDADNGFSIGPLRNVTSVEPLHVIPADHVAVPRAAMDALRAARDGRLGCPDSSVPPLVNALLDGEVSR